MWCLVCTITDTAVAALRVIVAYPAVFYSQGTRFHKDGTAHTGTAAAASPDPVTYARSR